MIRLIGGSPASRPLVVPSGRARMGVWQPHQWVSGNPVAMFPSGRDERWVSAHLPTLPRQEETNMGTCLSWVFASLQSA
jgi:hypothetical protein